MLKVLNRLVGVGLAWSGTGGAGPSGPPASTAMVQTRATERPEAFTLISFSCCGPVNTAAGSGYVPFGKNGRARALVGEAEVHDAAGGRREASGLRCQGQREAARDAEAVGAALGSELAQSVADAARSAVAADRNRHECLTGVERTRRDTVRVRLAARNRSSVVGRVTRAATDETGRRERWVGECDRCVKRTTRFGSERWPAG